MAGDPDAMIGGVDVRAVAACTCLKLRRASRRATQLYDAALAPAGLTITQLGILGHLYGGLLQTGGGLPIGELAERLGMDPTSLNRTLKPLEAHGLARSAPDRGDRRVRAVHITEAGRARLSRAAPLWAEAQRSAERGLGAARAQALSTLLDACDGAFTSARGSRAAGS